MPRSGSDYVASLHDGRAVLLDGEQVDDVSTHPAFAGAVRTMAAIYDHTADPANAETFTYASPTDGSPVQRFWMTPRNRDDLVSRRVATQAWAEQTCGYLGRSPDHVGSLFAGFAGALDVFAEGGPQYAENLERFYARARDESLYLSYTIIHPTIDRSKPPHEQYAPNLYVSVSKERDDGIELRGAQMLGTGSVMCDYVFVSCILPLQPGSEDYAISLVVPANAPGLRIHSRRPYAQGNAGGFDYPLSSRFDENDALVVFEDVFVPWEHVFAYRNIAVTAAQFQRSPGHSLANTQAQIRFSVKLRFLAGLARRIAEDSGNLVDPKTKLRLGQLAGKAQIPWAFVLAAEANSFIDEFGVCRPDPGMLYAAMTLQPNLIDEVLYSLREMTGGSVIQLPSSFQAFGDAQSAADFERFVCWPNAKADDRIKLLKLTWDAIGSEFAGRHFQYEMFYAGEPSVVQMRSFNSYPWTGATDLVDACLSGVDAHQAAALLTA